MNHLTERELWSIVEDQPNAENAHRQHLETCEECMQLFNSLLYAHDGMNRLEYHQPSMRFAKNIYELLMKREALNQSERFWIKSLQITFYLAAILILMAFSWWMTTTSWGASSVDFLDNELFKGAAWVVAGAVAMWLVLLLDIWLGQRSSRLN